jgi:hypothetical protein
MIFAIAVIEIEIGRHEGDFVAAGGKLDNRIPHQQPTTIPRWKCWFGGDEKDSQWAATVPCSVSC